MEELRYGARLSETSVGPCSSGLWQRLTQCSPAAYSCRCTTACSRSMKSLGIDVRMSATKLDAKVVGTRPASRTYSQLHYSQLCYSQCRGRGRRAGPARRSARSRHAGRRRSTPPCGRTACGLGLSSGQLGHSRRRLIPLLVERPEKVGEGQQQRGGGPRVRVRHDAEQGEPV